MDIIDEDIIAKADEGLLQLIEKAKVAALSKEEYAEYEASLKILSDDGLAEDFGYRRGKEEEAEQIAGILEDRHKMIDFEIHAGDQPVYYYIVSVE